MVPAPVVIPAFPSVQLREPARPARVKPRHWSLVFGLILLVLLPMAAASWYLWTRAADQFSSQVGFSVRREDTGPTIDLLGGLSAISGSSSSDTDILYEFIHSQEIVERLDRKFDLRGLYSGPFEQDPILAFNPDGTIEDLVAYWQRVVKISYDSGTGMIGLEVLAFDPRTAQMIATGIFEESSRMINAMSDIARKDATLYAREELDHAIERLKQARAAITEFRARNQIVDPSADIQGQMGLLNTLQVQQAAALIDLDLLSSSTRSNDPRIAQQKRKITVIEARIAEERRKFGSGGKGPGGQDFATLMAEFERLSVDREFAEQAYTTALTTYDMARSKAERQSRYLTAYINPTRAETARYPRRYTIIGLMGLFLFLLWSISVLILYSLRDRR